MLAECERGGAAVLWRKLDPLPGLDTDWHPGFVAALVGLSHWAIADVAGDLQRGALQEGSRIGGRITPRLIEMAERGQRVVITKHEAPVAILLPWSEFQEFYLSQIEGALQ